MYVRCLLHNFGGNIEMYGILDAISSGPVDARTSENSTMVCYAQYTLRTCPITLNSIYFSLETTEVLTYIF